MNKNIFKKITAIALAMLMLVSLFACDGAPATNQEQSSATEQASETEQSTEAKLEQYPENGAKKIVNVEKLIYQSAENSMPISVAYYENQPEILLIEINTAVKEFFNEFLSAVTQSAPATVEETDTTVTITRGNGAYCVIDFVQDTVFYSDFDKFVAKDFSDNPHDLLALPYVDENGNNVYIQRDSSFFTPGYGLEIDLGERDIPLDIYEGKKYLPMQTFNDLFISPFGVNIAYNGTALFFMNGNTLSPDLADIYYFEERTPRSEALAEFNFNELCLYLDLYYGLQNEHGFNDGFSYYLESIGLKEELLKLDAVNSFNAIATLTMGYIGDLHSAIASASPYLGANKPNDEEVNIQFSNDFKSFVRTQQEYQALRAEMLGEVEFYEKVGNTAYITFDSFEIGDRLGGYSEESLQIADTFTIIMAAHAMIAQDKEIENVVLDLSCNGGGAADAAVFTVAWMLGSCELSIYNTITESRSTTNYSADVNMDGKFDENDTVSDKNLYCIVSPVSFSCGNLVPALLKASGKATIIGKTSGGGACIVGNAVTADGTTFCISSTSQMSTVKNGTYYSVDQGVEPDISLTKMESFYDRQALTALINGTK